MLFKEVHLKGIKTKDISLAFRRWKKPAVKKGSLQKTSIGIIEITEIETIDEKKITNKDAQNAGYENRDALLAALNISGQGEIYKMQVRYFSADPRIKVREQTGITDAQYAAIREKLDRYDKYSKQGDWTIKVITAIDDYPFKRAIDIATPLGYEKDWFKINVRKLKNIGLTISHPVGYEISPFGKRFLERFEAENQSNLK